MRGRGWLVEAGETMVGLGFGRLLGRARKASRRKEENEVRESQKPVARPM